MPYYRWSVLGLTLTLCLLVCSCAGPTSTVSAQPPAAEPDPVPHVRDADDVGRFIAGMPGTAGSPFLTLEASEAWKQHRTLLDAAWHKAESPLMSGLRQFQKDELNDPALRNAHVLYPFSGPDALTVALCFPRSPVYVMVGLEPAGTLPSPSRFEKLNLPKYLAETRETVDSELSRSFFITKQMDRQFRGQVTDGLLLPILHLLVRMQDTILGFRYVRLDEQGKVIDRAVNYEAPGKIGNKGVEIEFEDSDHTVHQLYYFSVNLSDERLKEDAPFLSYLQGLKGSATLLKATSYMTHHAEFSIIRDQLLSVSSAILQDDSGLPYKSFHDSAWKVQLYGDYQRPYGSFRWLEQPDLRSAYAAGNVKPLSLHLGYGYSRIASNLLLARR